MSIPVIECHALGKQFKSRGRSIQAVSGVDLHVDRNELVVIKGRSGAGKSTLLFLMSGLVKPTRGKVTVEGKCISDMENPEFSQLLLEKIGFIFQDFNLLPTYTVFENIEIALAPRGLKKEAVRERIMSLLHRFRLSDKADALPSELSIGQQQKVAIVRTMAKEPSILFADEPTGSVDEGTAAEILEHLLYLKREKNVTLVIATHGSFPESLADRTLILEDGKLAN